MFTQWRKTVGNCAEKVVECITDKTGCYNLSFSAKAPYYTYSHWLHSTVYLRRAVAPLEESNCIKQNWIKHLYFVMHWKNIDQLKALFNIIVNTPGGKPYSYRNKTVRTESTVCAATLKPVSWCLIRVKGKLLECYLCSCPLYWAYVHKAS